MSKDGHNFTEQEQQTGMLQEHIDEIARVSQSNDTVLIFRPINPAVKERFREGCVGKGMDIKGKSADQGEALNGLIPVDAAFSKLGTSNQHEAVKEFTDKNLHKLEDDQKRYEDIMKTDVAKLTPQERIAFEESFNNLAMSVALKDHNGQQVFGLKTKDGHAVKELAADGKEKMVFVTKDQNDGKYYYETKKGDTQPRREYKVPEGVEVTAINVLAYRNLKLEGDKVVEVTPGMITADYDQFDEATKSRKEGVAKSAEGKPYAGYGTEQDHVITTVLAKDTEGNRAVSHNGEANNPLPEPINVVPIEKEAHVAFLPSQEITEKINKAKENGTLKDFTLSKEEVRANVHILKTETDLVKFYNKIEEKGYFPSVNPGWGWQRNDQGKLEIDTEHADAAILARESKKHENTPHKENVQAIKEEFEELRWQKLLKPDERLKETLDPSTGKVRSREIVEASSLENIPLDEKTTRIKSRADIPGQKQALNSAEERFNQGVQKENDTLLASPLLTARKKTQERQELQRSGNTPVLSRKKMDDKPENATHDAGLTREAEQKRSTETVSQNNPVSKRESMRHPAVLTALSTTPEAQDSSKAVKKELKAANGPDNLSTPGTTPNGPNKLTNISKIIN